MLYIFETREVTSGGPHHRCHPVLHPRQASCCPWLPSARRPACAPASFSASARTTCSARPRCRRPAASTRSIRSLVAPQSYTRRLTPATLDDSTQQAPPETQPAQPRDPRQHRFREADFLELLPCRLLRRVGSPLLAALRLDLQEQQDAVDDELPGQRLLVRDPHGGGKDVGRQPLGLLGVRVARTRRRLGSWSRPFVTCAWTQAKQVLRTAADGAERYHVALHAYPRRVAPVLAPSTGVSYMCACKCNNGDKSEVAGWEGARGVGREAYQPKRRRTYSTCPREASNARPRDRPPEPPRRSAQARPIGAAQRTACGPTS